MYSVVTTAVMKGMESILVSVEADVSDGLPIVEMVGVLSAEVKEAKERVRTALRNSGFTIPPKRITINLFPATIKKSGSGFDLPISISILAALGHLSADLLDKVCIIGEVGLDGSVRAVRGILPNLLSAKERGIKLFLIPLENLAEARLAIGVTIYGIKTLKEGIYCLKNRPSDWHSNENEQKSTLSRVESNELDFSQIKGQKGVKRACEIAVAGMHNLLMVGPPGSGKSMIAQRIPTILPELEEWEKLELANIYSISGLFELRENELGKRPFRSPHHTITTGGLTGGGLIPRPGEITLAHKGVLFLDELPEFSPQTLEILRQPLEEKKINLVRVAGTYTYPCDFILVAAMNPCKCGNYPNRETCRCNSSSIRHYLDRISQPLLDRLDICVEAPKIQFEELMGIQEEETSMEIKMRIQKALNSQKLRYNNCKYQFNAQLSAKDILNYIPLKKEVTEHLKEMYTCLGLTARSCHKLIKVARTIADLEQKEEVEFHHINEAVCYRSLDKKYWENGEC